MNATPTILVVDDEWLNRDLIEGLLTVFDYSVVQANGAKSAQAILAQNTLPDLIVMDVRMPDMDGYSLCKQIKADARTAHIPIIMITALEMTNTEKQNIADSGADDAVSRMSVTKTLVDKINGLLPKEPAT